MRRKTARSLLMLLAVLGACGSARAEDVTVLAKNYIASHDIALEPIGVRSNWLVGLDFQGEWTEYHFTVSGFGTNRPELVAMGAAGISFDIEMTLTADGSGTTQRSNFVFVGNGFVG